MKTAIELFELVADDIRRVEDKMRRVEEGYYLVEELQEVLEYLIQSGGKRIRPTLVLVSAQAISESPGSRRASEETVALAAAVEMLHTATLVHDDLIDNSLIRRGVPTLNSTWSPGATILTGDYIFARSAELAAQTENPPVISIFARTLMTICGGELRQVFSKNGGVPTLEEYYERIYAKTASLFATSTQAPGILLDAPPETVRALHDYGYNLGMAFQVIDDVLDFTGETDRIGKPVGNDLREGIITLPAIYFMRDAPPGSILSRLIAGEQVGNGMVNEAVEEIRASGAVGRAVQEAARFASLAQEALRALPDSRYRGELHALADFTVNRKL